MSGGLLGTWVGWGGGGYDSNGWVGLTGDMEGGGEVAQGSNGWGRGGLMAHMVGSGAQGVKRHLDKGKAQGSHGRGWDAHVTH
jgi:hypothetical protein